MDRDLTENMSLVEIEEEILKIESEVIGSFARFWDKRNVIDILESNAQVFLRFAKLSYDYHLAILDPDESDEELFFWKNNCLKVWCVGVNSKSAGRRDTLLFATISDENEIVVIDGINETSSPKFLRSDTPEKIKFLIDEKVIPDVKSSIVKNSANGHTTIRGWVQQLLENESKSIEKLATSSIELFDFNKATIRAKKYKFSEMLETIDNEQFTIEFDECLYAYNREKWFVCATGLGGVLEHLLYLILEKNKMMDKDFPDDPTAKIYIEYLSRQPIKLKKRERTHIRTLFLTRNSISHFNHGFTSKDQCSQFMNGIRDIFENYYLKEFTTESK